MSVEDDAPKLQIWRRRIISRRVENECAYCAEEFAEHSAVVGNDYKVYCSQHCAELGELLSAYEAALPYLNQYALAA
jgi:hypothetical protein